MLSCTNKLGCDCGSLPNNVQKLLQISSYLAVGLSVCWMRRSVLGFMFNSVTQGYAASILKVH